MEHLDGAAGDAQIDLGADQRMRYRVEVVDLDVIIEPDAGKTPFGELVIGRRQRSQRRPLDACEQIAPAEAEAPHEREQRLMPQPPENVALDKANAGFGRAGRIPTP